MPEAKRYLLSDNSSGVHPAVLRALIEINHGHVAAYGDDELTLAAETLLREHFGEHARPYFVTTGTAANVIGLRSVTRSYEAIICADSSHLNRDECGAAENIIGCRVLATRAEQGKLSVSAIEPLLADTGAVHRAQPRVVSISQCTEYGTLYSPEETRELADFCHAHGLILHMDGARLCNAAAALGCSLRQLSTDAGVDLLSFGISKNGALLAESVVVLNAEYAADLAFYRKQGMQLASKMRFLSAQFIAMLEGSLWLDNARHANAMARRLAERIRSPGIRGVRIAMPQQTNAVFAHIEKSLVQRIQPQVRFHLWDSATSLARLMTAFDTTEEDIDQFAALLKSHGQ